MQWGDVMIMRDDRGCRAVHSQTRGKEVGRQNPKTELLELGFVCAVENIGGGQ
jgi:hypothetical protein